MLPKYHNCDTIPAIVFFEIQKSKDYQKLKPKPKTKDLEEVFSKINDDYFIRIDNEKTKRFFYLSNEIIFLQYKINIIKSTLFHVYQNLTNDENLEFRKEIVKTLVEHCDIYFNIDEPIFTEIQRVLQIELGIIENDINLHKFDLEVLNKENGEKEFNFYSSIVGIQNVLMRTINPKMCLSEYIETIKSIK